MSAGAAALAAPRGPDYVLAVPTRDAITLRGMRFHARIGILPHERELAQPLEVDLTVWTQPRAGAVLDYRTLYDAVAGTVANGHTDYLEELAERIAASALGDGRAQRAVVVVRKPHVALPGPLAAAEVMIERERGG